MNDDNGESQNAAPDYLKGKAPEIATPPVSD